MAASPAPPAVAYGDRVQAASPDDPRAPIDLSAVTARLADPGRWSIGWTVQTGSTNADLAARAETGRLAHGQVLVTEEQTAGRGRAGRDWHCPPGAGLMFSGALDLPVIPMERRGWVGAVLGLSIVDALGSGAVEASLKWPNDVLIGGSKCAGILGEVAGGMLVVGSGINISLTRDELPRADATSLALAGGTVDRAALLAAILDGLGRWCDRWTAAAGDVDAAGIRARYRDACVTLGAQVRILLPSQRWVTGTATDVDPGGALVLTDGSGRVQSYTVGDVVHVRPA
jgi:BirA family biotin operon repressor/biotin-[acetyl-CoA-carboxylase] ligase